MSDLVVLLPDFVAHVAVGEVEAGEDDGLKLRLLDHVAVHTVPDQEVDEHHVGRVDEGDVLPALEEERPVHGPEPHDAVTRLEVPQLVAAVVEEVAQTLQELTGARLRED